MCLRWGKARYVLPESLRSLSAGQVVVPACGHDDGFITFDLLEALHPLGSIEIPAFFADAQLAKTVLFREVK